MGAADIAGLVRHERKRQGLTLEELAERVGLTAGALSHIETGRRLPSPEIAVAIAHALGLSETMIMDALDEAHRERRYDSLSAKSAQGRSKPRTRSRETFDAAAPSGFQRLDVNEVFGSDRASASPPARASLGPRDVVLRSVRDTARWSNDPTERLQALEQMADTASAAIRTLRGSLDDPDPAVRREAWRLLRELDVRLPEE